MRFSFKILHRLVQQQPGAHRCVGNCVGCGISFDSNSAIGPIVPAGTIGGFTLTRSLGAGDGMTETVATGSVMSTPTGTGNGGALFCRGARGGDVQGGCTLSILSCDMSRNRATSSGGAIFSQGDLVCAIRQGGTTLQGWVRVLELEWSVTVYKHAFFARGHFAISRLCRAHSFDIKDFGRWPRMANYEHWR